MASAEIITIGTEILLGELIDTNAPYIARELRNIGIDVYRKTSIGDNSRRIASEIQQALKRSQIIITTGGLGPTIDDPTREAVAIALGVELEFKSELWDQITERFRRYGRVPTENNQRQAYIPVGALPIENPVGTAPIFIYEKSGSCIICLPGVPREMEYLMQNTVLPYIQKQFPGSGLILAKILHTAGVGESQIDERISDLEFQSNPTVGLAAHSGQVDIRITAKARTRLEAIEMIQNVEEEIRVRIGNWIYGVDEETLEGVVLQNLARYGLSLTIVEAGLSGELIRKLSIENQVFIGGESLNILPEIDEMEALTSRYRASKKADICLGVRLGLEDNQQKLTMILISSQGIKNKERTFGGPPKLIKVWAVNHCLDILRKIEIQDLTPIE